MNFLWKIPLNGGGLDYIFSLGNSKKEIIPLPDISLLQGIDFVFSKNKDPSQEECLWLLNMQEIFTCAINEVRLPPNTRKVLIAGDSIQVGSLLFMLNEGNSSDFPANDNTEGCDALNPCRLAAESEFTEAPTSSALSSQPADSFFELADLNLILSDGNTDRSLCNISIENIELETLNSIKDKNTDKPAPHANQEKLQKSISTSKNVDHKNIIDSLHREYFDVLREPRLLASQNPFFTQKTSITDGDHSLQDLIRQASFYDSLHDLLSPSQIEKTLKNNDESLDDYEILQPSLKTDVMLLFAPTHLQTQNSISDFSQPDPIKDLIPAESGNSFPTHFQSLPTLNQREHHSAVVGGLMDLHPPFKKPQQDS